MKCLRRFLRFTAAVVLIGLAVIPSARGADVLYIGDGGDNSVKRFDAATGAPLDAPDDPFIAGVVGPRGLLVDGGSLLVVEQNVNLNLPGELLEFDAASGAFVGAIVAATDKDAPFAPLGMVLGVDDDLFVGNLTTANGTSPGRLNRYDSTSGELLSSDAGKEVKNKNYHPRGVVIGPDGLVYVSVRSLKKDGLGGSVLRFNLDGSFADVFVEDEGGIGHLNRPEGVVFGPDGNLYVTSFRAAPGDTDAIRIYDPDGGYLDQIDLHDGVTQPRTFAQALLFGPGGKLFVPMTGSGELRAYNSPTTGDYDVLVSAGSAALIQPWYLTFGQTNPSTLDYEE